MNAAKKPGLRSRRIDLLIFLPVIGVLAAIWAVVITFTVMERTATIERAKSHLEVTVASLADSNDLAERVTTPDEATASRSAAIWRALLEYPTANIWVDKDDITVTGMPPQGGQGRYIIVKEIRGWTTVNMALPEADVLADWRSSAWQRAIVLAVITIAFLLLTSFLVRSLRQRAEAEHEAAIAKERAAQLAAYKKQLEETVALRTDELRIANRSLGKELVERTAAEKALREHDALLNAITTSASDLLGAHSFDTGIVTVLERVAQLTSVGRVQLSSLKRDQNGVLRSRIEHEACSPDVSAAGDDPELREFDAMVRFPETMQRVLDGEPVAFSVNEVPAESRARFEQASMKSFLQIPVMVDGKLCGMLSFIDSNADRKWSWAETDVFKVLARLIGASIMRARIVKELADANMIVQNSPTILYRMRAEPPFRLVYISQNVTKFGHDPAQLLAAVNWPELIVDGEDHAKIGATVAQLLDKDAQGGTLEFRLRKGDGSLRWAENRYTPVRDKFGRLTELEGIIVDITERKAAEEKIRVLARTDGLTGLANRTTFLERLHQTFAATRRGGGAFAILYMDIDRFKDINDTLGHPVGDLLLKQVAERLASAVRDNDLVARLGGDEFAVLQSDITEPSDGGVLAKKLVQALAVPYSIGGNEIHVTASIGVCAYTAGSVSPDVMLSQADLALYRAKDQGRNQYRFHSDDLDRAVLERVTLTDELRIGIEKNELELYYQPQVEVLSGKITGVEALVRWHHPKRGLLQPPDFLPVAEQTGVIVALGHWVLESACRQIRLWRDEGADPPVMTVNLALAQLKNSREIVQDVLETIAKWRLIPSDFEFDVTEATIAHLTWTQNDALARLNGAGAKIAIDNFGTEYSSFDYLRSYNINHVKIGRSLIAYANDAPEAAATIRVMINMARELGIGITAEGIETEEQRKLLIANGAPATAQGFLFSRPVEAARMTELLRRKFIKPANRNEAAASDRVSGVLETGVHA